MKFWSNLAKALKLVKLAESEARVAQMLHEDPITVEMIARIAKEYAYHFEIVNKDGTILKFTKRGVALSRDDAEGEVW